MSDTEQSSIATTDDVVVMADLIRHPRRPREGTIVISYPARIAYTTFPTSQQ